MIDTILASVLTGLFVIGLWVVEIKGLRRKVPSRKKPEKNSIARTQRYHRSNTTP